MREAKSDKRIQFPPEEAQRRKIIEQINERKKMSEKIARQTLEQQALLKNVMESNKRNHKRLEASQKTLVFFERFKNSPEHIFSASGVMNEFLENYMIEHSCVMNIHGHVNPDNMSYEELIELGQKIGVVSKGLNKEQIARLNHSPNQNSKLECPICQQSIPIGEIKTELPCRHNFHDMCILEWLKDQNSCPMCKQHVLQKV